jgi:predicted MPP superfamily phosphohydrolase
VPDKLKRFVKKIAWLTDIHLNFVEEFQIEELCRIVIASKPDAVLIGGDISEAPGLRSHLLLLEKLLQCSIFFVLGNHDFYRGSISSVRQDAKRLSESSRRLKWLPQIGVFELTEQTGLLGHDTWADGRSGAGAKSPIFLNDFMLIKELRESRNLFKTLGDLGDEAAAYLKQQLPAALARFQHLIVLVHVPPFIESCWHEGEISGDDWLPHFTCRAVGETLRQVMIENPEKKMTVLCGHTHSSGTAQILPNLLVKTGTAKYGKPRVQEILTIE